MSGRQAPDRVDRTLEQVFEAEARTRAPDRMLEDVFERTRAARQARRRPWDGLHRAPTGPAGALVLVAALGLAAAALVVALGGGGLPLTAVVPPSPSAATPPPPVIAALCANGGGLAGDGRILWVRCPTGVRRVDTTVAPATAGAVLEGVGLPVALGADLWAPARGTIVQLDPASGRTLRALPISGVSLLAADGARLWAVAGSRLLRIDPATGAATTAPDTIADPLTLTVVGGTPWVTSGDGNARRFDPSSLAITATVPVGDVPDAAATDGTALYVVSQGNAGTVTRIDAARALATQAVLAEPTDPQSLGLVVVGDAGLLVTRRAGLLALDPVSLAVRSVTPLPAYPSGAVLAGRDLWVFGEGRLDRLPVPSAGSGTPPPSP